MIVLETDETPWNNSSPLEGCCLAAGDYRGESPPVRGVAMPRDERDGRRYDRCFPSNVSEGGAARACGVSTVGGTGGQTLRVSAANAPPVYPVKPVADAASYRAEWSVDAWESSKLSACGIDGSLPALRRKICWLTSAVVPGGSPLRIENAESVVTHFNHATYFWACGSGSLR